MGRCCVSLLIAFLMLSLMVTGCGQRQDQKAAVIKPTVAATENSDNTDSEDIDTEEAQAPVASVQASGQAAPAAPVASAAVETPKAAAPKPVETLVVADFDSGDKPNNVGTGFGGWNKDPSDPTQWCKESFDNVTRHGDNGFSMKLDYSVDSPNPAYNGFWMMLPTLDVSKYDTLSFWVKGDPKAGYTTVFKVELKNAAKQVGRYYVSNVSDQWQEISIPLSEFKGLIDKTNLTEFVVVFEDRMATNKKGVINIDDIKFTRSK